MSDAAFLTPVVEEEYVRKDDKTHRQCFKRTGMPEPWTIATSPFRCQLRLKQQRIMALYDTMDCIPTARASSGWAARNDSRMSLELPPAHAGGYDDYGYPKIPFTTLPAMSVRRKSRPL